MSKKNFITPLHFETMETEYQENFNLYGGGGHDNEMINRDQQNPVSLDFRNNGTQLFTGKCSKLKTSRKEKDC